MDEIQNQLTTGGSNLNQTTNPQAAPSQNQNLANQQSNLQTSSSDLLNQTGLKVVGVQGGNSQTATQSNPTVPTNTSLLPITLAFVVAVVILGGLVTAAIKKGQPPEK